MSVMRLLTFQGRDRAITDPSKVKLISFPDTELAYQIKNVEDIKKDLTPEMQSCHSVPYAILSHRWLDDEIEYGNFDNAHKWTSTKASAAKLHGACKAAREYSDHMQQEQRPRIDHIWSDTCCIDKGQPAEHSEAVNSMWRFYSQAEVCIVYLADVVKSGTGKTDISMSQWFERGWTLQELVASEKAIFYDAHWQRIGNKIELMADLEAATGVSRMVLQDRDKITQVTIAHRMSWMSCRTTKKEEDMAYSLLGIFGVNLPLIYGEGGRSAFRRLQEEILKYSDDNSIFAWRDHPPSARSHSGLLAPSPTCFADWRRSNSAAVEPRPSTMPYWLTNKGIRIRLPLLRPRGEQQDVFVASFNCRVDEMCDYGVFLVQVGEHEFRRIRCNEYCRVDAPGPIRDMYIKDYVI